VAHEVNLDFHAGSCGALDQAAHGLEQFRQPGLLIGIQIPTATVK
jgi:hypothetical protein